MKIAGIIAEYNPFHNGHKALNDYAAINGYTHCVAIMSGNFVQRSTPGITEKRIRTKAALKNGVDLVLELPVAYATATAQIFAYKAVEILKKTGVIDGLVFGSEQGDTVKLKEIAEMLDSPRFSELLPKYLETGITFAKARAKVVSDILSKEHGELISSPNNILGVEYLRAINQLGWNIDTLTLGRQGVEHHSSQPEGKFASASFIRGEMANLESIRHYVPASALEEYINAEKEGLLSKGLKALELPILSHLRRMSVEDIAQLPDISEGIEYRIYSAIQQSVTTKELYENIKTKRYTLSRVRRLVLSAFLSIKKEDVDISPSYIRVLGFNEKGKEILSLMKRKAELVFSNSLKTLSELSEEARRMAYTETLSTDLYTLSLEKPQKAGYDLYTPGVFLE